MDRQPNEAIEAIGNALKTGLVGTIAVAIQDNQGAVVSGPTTAGIIELEVSSTPTGIYRAQLTAPGIDGDYSIIWSRDGTFGPKTTFEEDLRVTTLTPVLMPLTPPAGAGEQGPCTAWTTVDLVVACCAGFADVDSDQQQRWIVSASELLFIASDRQFPGECGPVTVRPCGDGCHCWGAWNWGDPWYWSRTLNRWACGGTSCGCAPTSEIELAGVPIREIVSVQIDGDTLDPDEYGFIEPNALVRMRDPSDPNRRLLWPGCQIMDLDEDQPGTFAVSYTHGADPPQAGIDAASALACELWKACQGTGDTCAFPENVTRVVRSGIEFDTPQPVAAALKSAATGVRAIDNFIGLFGDDDHAMSSVWSPDIPFPRRYRASGGS